MVQHAIIDIDLRRLGGRALTADIDVPKDRAPRHGSRDSHHLRAGPEHDFPFVRAGLGRSAVAANFIGVNALDYSGYPDCRPEYIAAFERMANLATKAAVEGVASRSTRRSSTCARPRSSALAWTWAWTMRLRFELSRPGRRRRGLGGMRRLPVRRKGFAELGLADPAKYPLA